MFAKEPLPGMKLNFDDPEITIDDGDHRPIVNKKFPTLEINGEKYIIREWGFTGEVLVLRGWDVRGFPIEWQCDEKYGAMLFPDMGEMRRLSGG